MIDIVPNWHPIWVHFAIGLLITSAAIFLVFGWRSGREGVATNALVVARWTLWLGVLFALAALLTGWWASGSVAHDDAAHANMLVHRNWAIASTVLFAVAALLQYLQRNTPRASVLSIVLMAAGGIMLAVTGYEGAENVFEHGLGVQRLPQPSAHEHAGGETDSAHDHTAPGQESPEQDARGAARDIAHEHDHAATGEDGMVEETHPAARVAARLSDAIVSGDASTLKSLVAPDVLIFESGGVESSFAEYEGHHMPADMAFMKSVDRELLSRRLIDAGDSAVVVSRTRLTGTYRGQAIDVHSTETLVMSKSDGQWKITHIHWSSG